MARRAGPVVGARSTVAAASAVAAIISSDPGGRSTDLARLASQAVTRWHGRAPWVVCALPTVTEPAWTATQVITIADALRLEGIPCVTVVPLEMDSVDG